jgi:glycyl-tRNA synthetase beta subunit
LHSYDVGSILDYSIEGKTKQEEFDETADEVIRTIHKSKNERSLIPFCVFKPTGLARLELLTKVSGPIEAFFADVMVMDPDQSKRQNRLALLDQLYKQMNQVADISQLAQ